MPDMKCNSRGCAGPAGKECVAIDVNCVYDSCRDKDCFEDARVFLTEGGQDIINRTCNVRVKCTDVVGSCISCEPVQFNRGFYQVCIRLFTKLTMEGCVGGAAPREFDGVAVCDKRLILYGGEGEVSIFRSDPGNTSFCCPGTYTPATDSNAPVAACEVVDPIVLSTCVSCERRPCCCSVYDVPEGVLAHVDGPLVDVDGANHLYCTLGFFSVVRLERPSQYLVEASQYSVPDKLCDDVGEEDPCSAFGRMSFPVRKFAPPSICRADFE